MISELCIVTRVVLFNMIKVHFLQKTCFFILYNYLPHIKPMELYLLIYFLHFYYLFYILLLKVRFKTHAHHELTIVNKNQVVS